MVSAREGSSVSSRKDICSASAAIKEKLYMHGSFQFQRCIFVQCICSEVYVCTRHVVNFILFLCILYIQYIVLPIRFVQSL